MRPGPSGKQAVSGVGVEFSGFAGTHGQVAVGHGEAHRSGQDVQPLEPFVDDRAGLF